MPVSINNTQIVFNDATTQTTAAVVNTTAVLNATAGATSRAVGTYSIYSGASATYTSGQTVTGSSINVASGTWRAMGQPSALSGTTVNDSANPVYTTLFLRIS